MKAIILAAGRGSRMGKLTDIHPKCLVKIKGIPLIEQQLAAFRESGITEIGIITGYKRKTLQKYGLVEFFNPHWESTQMVTSLTYANNWLEKNCCIVSYSDLYYRPEALKMLIDSKDDISITYDPNWYELWVKRFEHPLLDAETFKVNSNGYLVEIGKKPNSLDQITGQYMGLVKFTPNGWAKFSKLYHSLNPIMRKNIHLTSLLDLLIKEMPIKALSYTGAWGEVDSPKDLMFYNNGK